VCDDNEVVCEGRRSIRFEIGQENGGRDCRQAEVVERSGGLVKNK
jgi:hypothetical protein